MVTSAAQDEGNGDSLEEVTYAGFIIAAVLIMMVMLSMRAKAKSMNQESKWMSPIDFSPMEGCRTPALESIPMIEIQYQEIDEWAVV